MALADEQLTRLGGIESRGIDAMERFKSYVDEVDQGVRAVENVLNQLTNNPPKM